MSEREMWWMLLVSLSATLPDGLLRMIAIGLTMASLVWVAAAWDRAGTGVRKLPELPTFDRAKSPLDARPHLPASVLADFQERVEGGRGRPG